jgi:hypothetical protein
LVILKTFSRSQKKPKAQVSDVFTYDEIPQRLRAQIVNIWLDCLGHGGGDYIGPNPAYQYLHRHLANEFGLGRFPSLSGNDATAVAEFFVNHADTEQALDIIQVSFISALMRHAAGDYQTQQWKGTFGVSTSIDQAIWELNTRFLDHGIGYQFVAGDSPGLVKKANEHLHEEAVLPALRLLHEKAFEGANEEYRKAHEHYRHGRQKECLNECLKAFESTMKIICKRRTWPHKDTDTAKTLIDTCLKNGLLPTFMQSHLTTIAGALESAIPTVRNKMGGHGQGAEPKSVSSFYAEYLLHETAVTIVFMVEAYKSIK